MNPLEKRVIRSIAQTLGLNESEITLDSTVEELNMDSLDNVEVVMGLEDEFHQEIDDDEVFRWQTVGDVVAYLSRPVT